MQSLYTEINKITSQTVSYQEKHKKTDDTCLLQKKIIFWKIDILESLCQFSPAFKNT